MIRVVLDAEADQDRGEDEPREAEQPEPEPGPDEDERRPRRGPEGERDERLHVELEPAAQARPARAQVELDVAPRLDDEVEIGAHGKKAASVLKALSL